MKKRLLSLALTLCLVITMLPTVTVTVAAGEDDKAVDSMKHGHPTTGASWGLDDDEEPENDKWTDLASFATPNKGSDEGSSMCSCYDCELSCESMSSSGICDGSCCSVCMKNKNGDYDYGVDGDYDPDYVSSASVTVSDARLESGKYYLSSNITVTNQIEIVGNVTLCLNGYRIQGKWDTVIEIKYGATLTLEDCQENGAVVGDVQIMRRTGSELENQNGTLNMNGGTIRGNINIYGVLNLHGGTIKPADKEHPRGINVCGTFNMDGGTITGFQEGCISVDGGTFTMSGGKITGNWGGSTGTVLVSSGTFEMRGGEISNNHATTGGGVYVTRDATFKMSGGSISGNSAGSDSGGGVFVHTGGTFEISGNPTIANNRGGNVYLYSNAVITISGTLDNSTPIGVTMNIPDIFTTGWATYMHDKTMSNYFTAEDNSNYAVVMASYSDSSELKLIKLHSHAPSNDSSTESENWIAWDSHAVSGDSTTNDSFTTTLPEKSGSYYLTEDVTISTTWTPADGTKLCLNGHTIKLAENATGSVIKVNENQTFTLTDCRTGDAVGKITGGRTENAAGGGVFVSNDATFTMYGGMITGNQASWSGGGVYVGERGTFNMYNGSITENKAKDSGGGVRVDRGTFKMYNGSITGNQASNSGGGVYVDAGTFVMSAGSITNNEANTERGFGGGVRLCNSSSFTMTSGTISNNKAGSGGGVEMDGKVTFTMEDGTISGNTSKSGGGGVSVLTGCTFTIQNGIISGNSAQSYGGGVEVSNGTFTMETGTIIENNTALYGGGVSIRYDADSAKHVDYEEDPNPDENSTSNTVSASFTMKKGTISGNTASWYGGGVYVENGTFTMSDGTISGNKATDNGGGVYLLSKKIENNTEESEEQREEELGEQSEEQLGERSEEQPEAILIMCGGSIVENTVDGSGGGVYVDGDNASFQVSGSPVITGNTAGNSGSKIASNVYLNTGRTIAVTAALNGSKKIGVTLENPDGFKTFACAESSDGSFNIRAYINYFSSDNDSYIIRQVYGRDLELHKHTYQYELTGTNQITETCSNGCGHSATATISVVESMSKVYTGSTIKAATVTKTGDFHGDTTITYAPTEPKDAGTVTASITVDGKTARVTYDITGASQDAPVNSPATISYTTETISFDSEYEVSTASDDTGTAIASGSTVTPGETYYVRLAAKTNYNASAWTEFPVASRPAAPSVGVVAETSKRQGDGQLTGVDSTMEYQRAGETNWTAITGTTVTGLAAGTYKVRYKATETAFSSAEATVTVAEGPTLTVTFETNGGSSVESITGLSYNDTVTATAIDTPTRSGYIFGGWYLGDVQFDFATPITANITLTASWTERVYATTTTTTTKNDDAAAETATTEAVVEVLSVTTTTDEETGTVTTTTERSDGSTTVVEEQTDGTVTTTNTTGDGVTGTVVTDQDGNVTEATAEIPAEVVEKGETVTLPVTVEAGNTLEVTTPDEVQVEIPVTNVTPTTVAVIVKEDGTEEIVKMAKMTEEGIALTLSGSTTMKIVDNSKLFIDVEDGYWGETAIYFNAAREVLNGTATEIFSPESSTTRQMLMTALARLDGEDTGTSNPYEAGMAWAVANGISDGTNATDAITREQLATMLWRYMGEPDSTITELDFTDADQVSAYAEEAVCWAVETGILSGKGNGILDPKGDANRAQIAQMLMNFINMT